MNKNKIIFSLMAMLVTSNSFAEEAYYGELSGFSAVELKGFTNGSQYDGQNNGSGVSVSFEPEYYYSWNDDNDSVIFSPFLRLDPVDSDREHFDLREFNWLHVQGDWELRLGLAKVFWGVAESKHLVDIINQTDSAESFDGEDKLGQPMAQLAVIKDWGTLRLFALPYFRERTFAGVEGRLRGSIPVDTDNPVIQATNGKWHTDVAVRYENTIGDFDFGVAHFSGLSRDPRLVQSTNSGGSDVLIPYYDMIDRTSLDVQMTTESWLWKLEAITNSGQGERFNAVTGGFEYSFYGLAETDIDLGLVAEYHIDDRGADAPDSPMNDEIFLATRFAFNDIDDSSILAGVIFDRLTKNRMYSVEASTRLGESYKVELEGRFLSGTADVNSIAYDTEDFVLLRLSRYF